MIYDSIEQLIGNTPLVRISERLHGLKNIELYAKLEYYNPFGSMKDRIAQGMLAPVLQQLISENKTVLESSSGNTAKALSVLCGLHNLPFKAVTNRIKYPEVRQILQVLDVDLEELPGLSDCADPHDPNDSIQYTKRLVTNAPETYHLTDQYFSELNAQSHYNTTGKELLDDLGKVDFLFGFLGTCGSTLGTSKSLREGNAQHQVFGVVSKPGHNIPGGRNLNELWEVGLFRREEYADLLSGTTQEAVEGMLLLSRKAGILCGPTSGLVFIKALEKLKQIDAELVGPEKSKAVFLAGDRMEPYLGFMHKNYPSLFSTDKKNTRTVGSMTEEQIDNAPELTVETCRDISSDPNTLIVDIRGNFAYSLGHIPGAINIQDELFAQKIESGVTFPQEKQILIVCRIGDISRRYAAFLKEQGREAKSLHGGMQAYKRADLPIEKFVGQAV